MRCLSCAHELRSGAKFCDQCGTPVAAATPAAAAEHRQLTVMFCDLVGSTALSERLDAESLREVVRAYQECAAAAVARFDGHVAQYLGDGILAYFGYPQAHEDDAERAVRAGIEIPRALRRLDADLERRYGVRLRARVGIHSGPVVVGEMGGGARRETLAMGATTNIAARLESLATADAVVISGATLQLVPGLFVVEDLGTPRLKGVSEKVRAWRVRQASGVRGRLGQGGRLTPFVGRQEELRQLGEDWRQVLAGENRAFLLSGEAGLGKSRLLLAFKERLAADPHTWIECRGAAWAQNSAFQPIRELIEQGLAWQAEDPPERKLERLARALENSGLDAAATVPLFAGLLSVPLEGRFAALGLSPEMEREKTMQAALDWLLALGRSQPVVMVIEDLQWCDPSTLELLSRLFARHASQGEASANETEGEENAARILALLTHRPGFEPPWPDDERQRRRALEPLSTGDVRRLAERMSHGRALPKLILEQIVERADGIPLYTEELTKVILESGALRLLEDTYELDSDSDLAIPATLRGLLTARLDRLPEARPIAQLGAVLGREFSFAEIAAAGEFEPAALVRGLAQLTAAELLYERGTPPDAVYSFKHALVQDTAYRSLLRRDRQKLHGRVARTLAERTVAPEVLARHYEGAGLAFEAADAYRRAGDRAACRAANAEALRHLGRALELLAQEPATPRTEHLELAVQTLVAGASGSSKGYGHPDVGRAASRARELARRVASEASREDNCEASSEASSELENSLIGLWVYHLIRAELEPAGELAAELLSLAEQRQSDYLLVIAHGFAGGTHYFKGEPAAAWRHLERAIGLYRASPESMTPRANHIEPGVFVLAYAPYALFALGREPGNYSAEAIALARRIDSPPSISHALSLGARFQQIRGDVQAALAVSRQAVDFCAERGFPYHRALAGATLGWAMAKSATEPGPRQEGRALVERAVEGLERMKTRLALPNYALMLADLLRDEGELERARRVLEETRTMAEATGQRYCLADLDRLAAEILQAERELL